MYFIKILVNYISIFKVLIMQKILMVITLLLFNFHEVIPLQSQSFSSIVIMANYTAYQFAININV